MPICCPQTTLHTEVAIDWAICSAGVAVPARGGAWSTGLRGPSTARRYISERMTYRWLRVLEALAGAAAGALKA